MASEASSLSFSVASVLEDVLHQHGHRLQDLDLEYRKVEQAGIYFLFIFLFIEFSSKVMWILYYHLFILKW